MKKYFCLATAIVLTCALLTGCGAYSDADPGDTTTDGVIGDGVEMGDSVVDYAGSGYPNSENDMDTAGRSRMDYRRSGRMTEYTTVAPSGSNNLNRSARSGK